MKSRISLVTLGVADLARSIRFYEAGLGLHRRPHPSAEVAFFDLDGAWLALFGRAALAADAGVPAAGEGFRGITLAHNVAAPDEVAATLAEAERAGATIVKPATEAGWGGVSGYFADPDGHLWEVAWNPEFDLS